MSLEKINNLNRDSDQVKDLKTHNNIDVAMSEQAGYDAEQLIVNNFEPAPSMHAMNMNKLEKYPTPAELNRTRILSQCKAEISMLLQLSEQINQVTPLIYEEEHVVEHL